MFKRIKTPTLAEEIDLYTQDLKELYRLREQAERQTRAVATDRAIYMKELERHHQAISTCQLVLMKLLNKASKQEDKQ